MASASVNAPSSSFPSDLISNEKLPTDFDRATTMADQSFQLGTIPFPKTFRLESSSPDLPATIITLFGTLIKRYTWEGNIHMCLSSDETNTTVVALSSLLSHESLPINKAIGMMQEMLSNAKEMIPSNISETETFPTSFHINGMTMPRDWVHVSMTNLDTRELDLYLLVEIVDLTSQEMTFTIRYNKALFAQQTMEAMMRSWETLLESFQHDATVDIHTIQVVSPSDLKMLIHERNNTQASFPNKKGLQVLFEEACDATPSNRAIVGPSLADNFSADHTLTYSEVEAQANQICHYLIKTQGVKPGDNVSILLERSVEFYVAMLAVLKSGACYVPLDPEHPNDRLTYILEDSNAKLVITTNELGCRLSAAVKEGKSAATTTFVCLDRMEDAKGIKSQPTSRPVVEGAHNQLMCYILYTSGSTGKPKGVQIIHENVINLVYAEEPIFRVTSKDVILQGYTQIFDLSVEKIWQAFAHSATLVVATKTIMLSGPDFPTYMKKYGITWVCTTPSVLSTVEGDLDTVRMISTGGEPCSKELVNRWSLPGKRQFFNLYGPTETTITTTIKECFPGLHRLSIGRPLANYQVYILDANMSVLPPGAIGELVIGGVSVSRHGYRNLPEKTAAAFRPDTLTNSPYHLYRTGDLARMATNGDVEHMGRIDCQVKIRGYRIELNEIESVMCEHPWVKSAVVDAQEHKGQKYLVGFVIPSVEAPSDKEDIIPTLLVSMKDKLTPYMIPSAMEVMEDFPKLASGKVERKRLPRLMEKLAEQQAAARRMNQGACETVYARMSTNERLIAGVWNELLGEGAVQSPADSFFDLGGHSLLVSRMVNMLRENFPTLAAKDVYSKPRLCELAQVLDEMENQEVKEERHIHTPTWFHTLAADCEQLFLMYFIAAHIFMNTVAVYMPFFIFVDMPAVLMVPAVALTGFIIMFFSMLVNVFLKSMLLGQLQEGEYPLWGSYHIKYWFVKAMHDVVMTNYSWLLSGNPLLIWYLRAMGTRIGTNVIINGDVMGFDLVTIGNDCTLNDAACISASSIKDGMISFCAVKLGDGVTLGTKAMIQKGVVINDHAIIGPLSCVAPNAVVGVTEKWVGSPAQLHSMAPVLDSEAKAPRSILPALQWCWICLWTITRLLYIVPFVQLMTYYNLDFVFETYHLASRHWWWSFIQLMLVYTGMNIGRFVYISLTVAVLKRILLVGMSDVEIYSINSIYNLRRWIVNSMMADCSELSKGIRCTTYLTAFWWRLMGATIGSNVIMTAHQHIAADKLVVGDDATIADNVIAAMPYVERGVVYHGKVRVSEEAFIGNDAVIPPGTSLPQGMLLGLKALAPGCGKEGAAYLGNPPMEIKREGNVVPAVADGLAHHYNASRPTWSQFITRCLMDVSGWLSIAFFSASLTTFTFVASTNIYYKYHPLDWLLFPVVTMVAAVLAGVINVVAKWVVVGRFKAGDYPVASFGYFRIALYESYEDAFERVLMPIISGSIWMQWYFRLLGAKVGSRCYFDRSFLREYDLVTIGDYVAMGRHSCLQPHLFQDRIRTLGRITIGSYCSISNETVVAMGSSMGDRSSVGPLSFVPRYECLPKDTAWAGLPVVPVKQDAQTGSKTTTLPSIDIIITSTTAEGDVVTTSGGKMMKDSSLVELELGVPPFKVEPTCGPAMPMIVVQ